MEIVYALAIGILGGSGVWLLLRGLGVVNVGFWQLFWPTMMVLFGGSLILKTLRQSGHVRLETWHKGAERLFAVMSESRRRSR